MDRRKLTTRCLWTVGLICLGTAAALAKTNSSPAYKAGNFDDAIADSTLDFSNAQGNNGWSYGYWVDSGSGAPGRFVPFDSCKDGMWCRAGSRLPNLTRADLYSGPLGGSVLVAVRRWTATRTAWVAKRRNI